MGGQVINPTQSARKSSITLSQFLVPTYVISIGCVITMYWSLKTHYNGLDMPEGKKWYSPEQGLLANRSI